MTIAMQTLGELKRQMTLELDASEVARETQKRLQRYAASAKLDGFRPGKAPLEMLAARYGAALRAEVIEELLNHAFRHAVEETKIHLAGWPQITQRDGEENGKLLFDAVFELYPQVKLADWSPIKIERIKAEIKDAEIDEALEEIRRAQRHFHARGAHAEDGADSEGEGAQSGDQVVLDFDGRIGDQPFAGGKGEDVAFVIGEGRMLEGFEREILGMKAGQSKIFDLPFAADYGSKEIAGKTATFTVKIKSVAFAHTPVLDDAFAQQLGVTEGGLAALREQIRARLEREARSLALMRNKRAAFAAVRAQTPVQVPDVMLQAEIARRREAWKTQWQALGQSLGKSAQDLKTEVPDSLLQPLAEEGVRTALILEQIKEEFPQVKPDGSAVRAYIESKAQSYRNPSQYVQWVYGENARLDEAEAELTESNIAELIFSKVQVSEQTLSLGELRNQEHSQPSGGTAEAAA